MLSNDSDNVIFKYLISLCAVRIVIQTSFTFSLVALLLALTQNHLLHFYHAIKFFAKIILKMLIPQMLILYAFMLFVIKLLQMLVTIKQLKYLIS